MTVKQKYLIYLSYLGTCFRGSQIQNNGNLINVCATVQGTVEQALCTLLKLEGPRPIQVSLSSRTDSGVHALRTAVHVELPPFGGKKFLMPESIQWHLNKYFAKKNIHIKILEVLEVPDIFHARSSSIEKVYLYRVGIMKKEFLNENLSLRHIKSVLESDRTFFLRPQEFDIKKAHEVSQLMVGKKDFGAFVGPSMIRENFSTICNITSFSIEEAQPLMPSIDVFSQRFDYYHFVCKGQRFLYHMVRKMIGVILGVTANIIPIEKAQLLFDEPRFESWSSKVFVTPGYGLYLLNVSFNPKHLVISEEEKNKKLQLLEEQINELLKKKKELKPCSTVITSLRGDKYVESKNDSGELEREKLEETCPGFVVDEKLDLQIAQILNFLYLSSQDPAQDVDLLLKNGITHVLSLGVNLPTTPNTSRIKFMKLDLLDEPGADLEEVLADCFNIIDEARKENDNNKILVHCNAGYSRAPTVVIGYLMKTFGYSLNQSFQMVKDKRNIKPNDGFMKQLKELEKKFTI